MPAHNSVWTHDNQGCAPIRPRIGEQHPKESISVAELGTFYGALADRQLLAECQILERDRPLSTADERERSKRDDERSQHRLSCLAINLLINGRRSDFGERQGHFRRAVSEFAAHYHREMNHQGLENALIEGAPVSGGGRVHRLVTPRWTAQLLTGAQRDQPLIASAQRWDRTGVTARRVLSGERFGSSPRTGRREGP